MNQPPGLTRSGWFLLAILFGASISVNVFLSQDKPKDMETQCR